MAKDKKKYETEKKQKKEEKKEEAKQHPEMQIPPELKEKLEAIKVKLDKFKSKIVEKFDKYIVGVALLPPPRPPMLQGMPPEVAKEAQEDFEKVKDKIQILVLVDDTEPTKMSKQELKDKLITIMESTAKEIDPQLLPQTILLTELWQNCYDGKYDMLQTIALSAPVYDTGMLSAIKIAEIHKTMVLKKFEKYIVAYVLAGSLVQGKATKESDIDVFIVIDDTDVKKMTRAELKDKLRAIIIGMGLEAGEITGIRNKINIQVYILTDFWDSIREANPVIFTFLRDGVPFYDRGIFMPWKQLLKMGKVKPSPEAIDMYMSTGEQVLDRVKFKLREIGVEDFFWAILTPSQAALMLYGIPPPAPKETPDIMREVFVKKEKLMTDKEVDILEQVLKVRKDIEHGAKKDVSGKEIDELVENCDKYLKRIRQLFSQIERIKEEKTMVEVYDMIVSVIRDVLRLEGVEKMADEEITERFEEELIATGKIPAKFLRSLHEVVKAKNNFEAKKLSKLEVEKAKKEAHALLKFLIEYIQRKRGRELERAKLRVKYGSKFGEVTLLGNIAYVVQDLDADEKEVQKAKLNPDGSLGPLEKSSLEELEGAVAKVDIPPKVFLKEPVFESLKKIYGRDVEIMVSA